MRQHRNRQLSSSHIGITAILLCAGTGVAVASEDGGARFTQEFRASTFVPSSQEEAALAINADGSFVAIWASRRQQQGRYGVYAQRFDSHGIAIGSETAINLWPDGHALSPAIDAAADGSSWAVWQSTGQDGSGSAIIARHFDSHFDGGSEILINETTQGDQARPVVAALPDGGAIIAWETPGPDNTQQVMVRQVHADGTMGVEMRASMLDNAIVSCPSLAVKKDGSFALAYSAFAADGSKPLGVRVQRFDSHAVPVGQATIVSLPGATTPVEPSIAATESGYVVAWNDVLANQQGAPNYDILACTLDGQGRLTSLPTVVNTDRLGLQNAAAVAVAPDGTISIAYNSRDESKTGVFVRSFDASLRPMGESTRLSVAHDGPQAMRDAIGTRRLGFAPNGTLICAWQGQCSEADRSSANVTMRSPVPFDLDGAVAGVREGMEPAMYEASGTRVALAGGPEPHEPPTFDPRDRDDAPREFSVSRSGIGFTGIVNTGWTPPDPHMAVGPNNIVTMTNGAIAFFDKDGTLTFQDEIEDSFGFWGSTGATGFVFDPEVIYDPGSGRFFAMAAEGFAPGNRSYVLIAVSDDSDPNGSWFKYRLETTGFAGDLFDSPNIGVTDNALIVTGDGFGFSANYPVYIWDKASFLVGNPPAISNSFTLATSTQSAGFPRVTPGDRLYLVEHQEGNNRSAIRMLAIDDLLGSPTVSSFNLGVPTYGNPEDPPQKGTSSRPNTFDARFWSVDISEDGGSLYATHHINPNKVVARWYQIGLQGWPTSGLDPVLWRSEDIDLGPDIRTCFSSINVSSEGSVALSYTRSSPNEFLSAASSYRKPCTGEEADSVHKVSTAGYTQGRWGDYSSVQFDPADSGVYWATHEYAEGNSWRTWIQSVDIGMCFCPGDYNLDGITNTIDIANFLNDWTAGVDRADWNQDGSIDTLDVLAFLNDWVMCVG